MIVFMLYRELRMSGVSKDYIPSYCDGHMIAYCPQNKHTPAPPLCLLGGSGLVHNTCSSLHQVAFQIPSALSSGKMIRLQGTAERICMQTAQKAAVDDA